MVFPKVRLMYKSSSPIIACSSVTASSPVHVKSLPGILVGLLVLVVVAPLQAQPLIPSGNSLNFEYKRYCSSSLLDVIRLICGESYSSQQYAHYATSNRATFSSNSLKRLANDGGIYFRSFQTQGIHECCQRPCGFSELKMYCGPI